MIRMEDVHKSFGNLEVLKGINLHVKEGEKLVNIAIAELMGKTFQLIQISPRYTGFTTQNVSDVFVLCGLACVIYFAINFTLSCIVRRMQIPKKHVAVTAAA